MQSLSASPSRFYPSDSAPVAPVDGKRHGFTARLIHYADKPWATGLASFVTTAIILLPFEYEVSIRSLLMFLSSRRF